MSETALQQLDWQTAMDYHLSLMLRGYNSNHEYYEDGDNKAEIEKILARIYASNLEFVNNNGHLNSCSVEKYFVNTYGLEEDVLIESSEHQYEAACIWVCHSEEYEEERRKLDSLANEEEIEEKMDNLIEDMCICLSESEYSSYHPYQIDVPFHFYATKGFSFINSESFEDIYLLINDCQNSLSEETKNCYTKDSGGIAYYEYDLIEVADTANFIRIPEKVLSIGDGK